MRFVASTVVQYSYRLSFGDCAAPCPYFIIFFVIFEGFGVGGLGSITISLPKLLISFPCFMEVHTNSSQRVLCILIPQPINLVCKCMYLLGNMGVRSVWYCTIFLSYPPLLLLLLLWFLGGEQ